MLHTWLGGAPRLTTICALIAGAALLFSALMEQPHAIDPAWIAVVFCGVPILYTALHGLTHGRIHAELLVSAALLGTILAEEYLAAGGIALIMQFGTMLEERMIRHAQNHVDELLPMPSAGNTHNVDIHAMPMVQAAERKASGLIVLALVLAGLIWWGTGDFNRTVTALVVFCPCAFVHATPTAISAAVGNLAQRGILLRRSDSLERLSHAENIAFDLGMIAPTDHLHRDVPEVIKSLRRLGMHPVLLTATGEDAAAQIAAQAGIKDIRCTLPPQNDPFAFSTILVRSTDSSDAAQADCIRVAMGGPQDAADADIVCSSDDLRHLPALLGTIRQMRQKIEQNIIFGLTLNFIALGLAAIGFLTPLTGALWHNAAAIFIVLNAAALLSCGKREKKIAFSTSV